MQCEGVFRMYTRSGDDKKGSFGVGMDALLWMKSDWGVTTCYALVFSVDKTVQVSSTLKRFSYFVRWHNNTLQHFIFHK